MAIDNTKEKRALWIAHDSLPDTYGRATQAAVEGGKTLYILELSQFLPHSPAVARADAFRDYMVWSDETGEWVPVQWPEEEAVSAEA